MPSMSGADAALGANTTSANVLAGANLEYVPYRARVSFFCAKSAAGVRATFLAGQDVAIDDQEIPFIGAAFINQSDNLMDSFDVLPGTKLQLRFRNTTGGALGYVYQVVITPI